MIGDSGKETVKVTSMVFEVLIGATAFAMIFNYSGGDIIVEEFMSGLPGEKWTFIGLSMLAIFILGFFIDFVEIAFIIVPILAPIAEVMGLNMVWFAILIAMNLQSSFMTPPFGFSLFYLKGVAPPSVKTTTIYKGVIPFICIQLFLVILLVAFPEYLGFD
jgi:TRAP-type mannitol/chloroaromatic compound transport system permease large subunit